MKYKFFKKDYFKTKLGIIIINLLYMSLVTMNDIITKNEIKEK